ncbi:hypothetical protein [Desulfovibrio sp. SGI.169]|uniref:hypothetical protein n=1 Tax=Desulfovibrio sp. SGI.169 TaxID=3420561 RepID=UPI003D01F0D5
MTANSQERKALAISGIAENFGKELSPVLLRMWLRLLEGYTAEQVEVGAVRVIGTYAYKTMPPFAVLREAIEDATGGGPKGLELQASAEWGWLMEQVEKGVLYRSPEEVHPTTAHVVRIMGGWAAVGAWERRNLDFKRRDFFELWTQAHGKVEVLEHGAPAVAQLLSGRGMGIHMSAEKALVAK